MDGEPDVPESESSEQEQASPEALHKGPTVLEDEADNDTALVKGKISLSRKEKTHNDEVSNEKDSTCSAAEVGVNIEASAGETNGEAEQRRNDGDASKADDEVALEGPLSLSQKETQQLCEVSTENVNSTAQEDLNTDGSIAYGGAEQSRNDNDTSEDEEEVVVAAEPEESSITDPNVEEKEELDDVQFTSEYLSWYNPIRNFCGSIVNDMRFQLIIILIIVINALLMGVATYDFVEENPRVKRMFEVTDQVFLVIFTIECALQLCYHGYELFFDGWLTFDLFVVVMSWSLSGAQIFRAFRVFRAFRLVARLDVLKDLVNAIVAVLPRIGSIMLLFGLVLYIYAVLTTVLFGKQTYGDDNMNYFGRLDYSLFTLFQFVTLEAWGDISREVMTMYPYAVVVFLSFLTVSSFILYSLVVAVVCDAVAVVEHPDIALKKFEEKMQKEQKKTKRRVRKLRTNLSELSEQQMEILLSVQNSLMKYKSFRQDAEISQLQANVSTIR